MTATDIDPRAQAVLQFWFGARDESGLSEAAQCAKWYKKDPAFDALIRERFLQDFEGIEQDEREDWLKLPESRLAYVIVLDQFSRNMFRDTGDMFRADERALWAVKQGIARGDDLKLKGHARVFFYMPFMHSEKLDVQNQGVETFGSFRDAAKGALRGVLDETVKYAIAHRDIIERWGRFPHRNALLDRTSTGDELSFLQEPGSSF